MASLKEKLLNNSSLKHTAMLDESKIYDQGDIAPTGVPLIDTALYGSVEGGLPPGLLTIAGPSKHFKSLFSLLLASAFLRKHKDAYILFYDSEFGTNEGYFEMFGIPMDRVIHCPITDVEELKHDIMQQLDKINRGDKVFILVDSIGNLASKKEVEDSLSGKSVADMTRAKALKSLFRMVTPHLNLKDIPMVIVNHTYKEIGLFPKDIVSGGTGSYYSSNAIWIIGRQQDKDGTDLTGFRFIINIEKSRYVKEKSKLPIEVDFEHGLNKWSGLFDVALELGYLKSPSKGWYCTATDENKKFHKGDIQYSDEFWEELFKSTDFADAIKKKYRLGE